MQKHAAEIIDVRSAGRIDRLQQRIVGREGHSTQETQEMNRLKRVHIVATFSVVAVFCGCSQQKGSRINADPRADEALRRMGEALGKAHSFAFRSAAVMDEPVARGQMVQVSRDSRIVVRRPDATFVESRRGDDVWHFWYQGTVLTLLDRQANAYASVKVPGRIEDMLEEVAQKHGLTLPLADLLLPDPYRAMTAHARSGRYVGLHDVGGIKCHHLLFVQEAIDWQIWVDAGREPVPRKVVIDYKHLPGRPKFSAVLSEWNLSAKPNDEQFKAALPKDAKSVEMAKLLDAERGK